VVPKSRLAEGIGYFGLYGTLAGAIAPGVALGIVGEGKISDFQLLFFISSGVCVMSMVFDCFITYERRQKKASAQERETGEAPARAEPCAPLPKTFLGFEYTVFLPMAVLIILFFASSSVNTFLTLFAKERGLGNIGLYYTINAVGLFLSRILFGRLTDRRGADIVVIPGTLGIVACLALIPFVRSMPLLCVIALPYGLASGAVFPSINSMIFKRSSPQRRGTASAAYFAAIDIGFALGGLVFGMLADSIGYGALYWISAGLSLLALVLYMKTIAEKRPVKAA
jgi:predicted MFS family arabinose efflux permease